MNINLERDYVWQCDYGERNIIIPTLEKLLREQNSSSLQMIALFINNNPYCLEFYLVVSYDIPEEGSIKTMLSDLSSLGLRYRTDITFDELLREQMNRRFNSYTLVSEEHVKILFEGGIFAYKEKKQLELQGYIVNQLGDERPVFLSHSSKDKPDIEDLIPYLNASGLPIWYDKINIDYGDSIINEVQKGIKKSGAVIFWITKDFLNSRWCRTEMDSFMSLLIGSDSIKIISILEDDVNINDLPLFLQGIKFLKFSKPLNLELVSKEILPTLKKHFNIR
ncbi:toll/interleukin-1 receptor domain-containing protein [Clostridium tertium]|uniref:toll/interleukin-1 receptor domain-containing protein n=1 Tax=Clostridium tertium TaxID=1559 RepID=UPI0024B35835|nr:toll/interleukin-1 receptor domain-containing protein [Clostridium tertium]MDI9216430.1 toll/interleukin-1 receptor domain-containing protein [Clostridium tertium]